MCRTSDMKSKILLGLQGTTSFPLRGSYKYKISSMSPSGRLFYFGTINDIYNKCVWLEEVLTSGIATCESSVNYKLLNMRRIKKMLGCLCNSSHVLPFKNLSIGSKWTTKCWEKKKNNHNHRLSFWIWFLYFSCACNWAERHFDLVVELLSWST